MKRMKQTSYLNVGRLVLAAVMCLSMFLLCFLSLSSRQVLAENAGGTPLHERWTVADDGKISASFPDGMNWDGDIEARASTGYLTYKFTDRLSARDEYYTSVTVNNIGDLNKKSPVDVQIVPWYVNKQNWVMFSIHAWTGDNANIELVSKWFVNGEANGDNWQDNSYKIFSGNREEWNNFYSANAFTIWARVKGDQVLFGIDTQEGEYKNKTEVFVPNAGRDWNTKNKYQGTFEIPGLADAMASKWDSSYAGFDARRCSATFDNFSLSNEAPAVNQAIAYAKFDIERYVSEDNYYTEQREQMKTIVSNAKSAFERAENVEALNESVAGYRTQIENVATKDEVDVKTAKEGLTWATINPDAEIDNVLANFTLPAASGDVAIDWSSNSSAIIVEGTTAKVVPSAEKAQKVTLTATLAKNKTTDTKTFEITVAQSGDDSVNLAKNEAIAKLDEINNDNNFYNTAEWSKIEEIIALAKTDITEAADVATINETLSSARQKIQFITDKVTAKNEISAYASSKGESNYHPGDWARIEQIVTEAQTAVDAATAANGISEAVMNAKTEIDNVKPAIRSEGDWIVNEIQKSYTGDDTADTIDDPQMRNIYLIDSAYKTGYKVSVTVTAKETNGRPGTRVGLIPWYIDSQNYISVYLSKSVWDGNAVSMQLKAIIGGKQAFLQFYNVLDNTHELIDVDYTLTASVEDNFVVVWYNGILFLKADVAGIADASVDADVKIGMTVCNTKAEFRNIEQKEIKKETEIGKVGDYTVKGSGDDFWSVSGTGEDEVIVGNDGDNIGLDSHMAYYAVKQFDYFAKYLVSADMKVLESSSLVNGKVGLVPLFVDDNNWVAVYMYKSSADDGQIVLQLQVKLGGEIVCTASEAIYPATEEFTNVSRGFTVYVSGDTIIVCVDGSKNYAIGKKVDGLSGLAAGTSYAGVSVVGTKAEFSNLSVIDITSAAEPDPNLTIAIKRYELENYKSQDDYYAEEWGTIEGYVADVINAMEDDNADVEELIADAKTKIDLVKTKTQVDAAAAEEIASKTAAAGAELDAYLSAKNSADYADETWKAMQATIAQAKTDLAACKSQEEIDVIVSKAKEDVDAFTKLPTPAPKPVDDENAQGLTAGEIVAIVLAAVFVAAAVVGLVLTVVKIKRGKRK